MTSIADVNPATITLRNPDVVPKKGRPKGTQKGRRLMPLGEVVRSKKQITCSNCGSHEHNKATCSLPPNDVPFQKKKTRANNMANTGGSAKKTSKIL
jgi:hypothetical protein